MDEIPKKKTGFALWKKKDLRKVSQAGGKKAHELGKAHQFTSEEAVAAGSKGGFALKALRDAEKQA